MDCYTAFVVNYHNHSRTDSLHNTSTKAEFAEEGTFFTNRFPSQLLLIKFKKLSPPSILGGLSFLNFINKSWEGNLFVKKVPSSANSALVLVLCNESVRLWLW